MTDAEPAPNHVAQVEFKRSNQVIALTSFRLLSTVPVYCSENYTLRPVLVQTEAKWLTRRCQLPKRFNCLFYALCQDLELSFPHRGLFP